MMADPVNRPRWSSERGSFIVAMIFFIFLFLIVAAMGVDMGRYFYTQQQNQNIADGATLAAAQAFNQIRSLSKIDRSDMTDAAFHHIAQRTGYDTGAYELSATFKTGDLLSDSFVDDTQADYLGDTYIRVGMNVKYYFEPYFLPRWAFGDEFFAVQSQATAELHPVFWTSNLYDPFEPGPPIAPLQYSIYSKEDIKPEDQDCFVSNGDLYSRQGYVKVENMAGSPNCRDSDGNDHWGLDNGDLNFSVDGNFVVGDPDGTDDDCSGNTPGAGCMVYENIDGWVKGDLRAQDDIDRCTGVAGCPLVGGDVEEHSTEIPDIQPELIEEGPDEAPGDYPGTVCRYDVGADNTKTFNGPSDFSTSDNGNDCSGGGTIYVENDGNMKIEGMNPSVAGDFTFVADGSITINDVQGNNGHFENDQFSFISLNEWIKMQNTSGDIEMDASFYAPTEGDLTGDDLCNPVQVGCVKVEEGDGDLTINGSIVAGTLAKVENQNRFRMNWQPNTDVLPDELRQLTKKNDVPDYWEIHLID